VAAALKVEEIQAMFQVDDLRKTRVYQEAWAEGFQIGIEITVKKLAARNLSAAEIADILGLDLELVQKTMGKKSYPMQI